MTQRRFDEALVQQKATYEELGFTDASELKDRFYFHSMYVRSPGGILVACDVRDNRMALLRRTVDVSGVRGVRLVQALVQQRLSRAKPCGTC